MFVHPFWKMLTVGESRPILVMQIMYNARRSHVKTLNGFVGHACIFFKCDELKWSTAFRFNSLLIFLEHLFEFLINTTPPASDSIYQQKFTAKKLQILLFPLPLPLFCGYYVLSFFFFNHTVFTYWLVSICLYCCPFTPSRGVAINVFLVVTNNQINK